MKARDELTIRRALKAGGLTPRQELNARRALRDNPEDVSDIIQMLQPQQSYRRGKLPDLKVASQSRDEQVFDTSSGIKNAALRASLSMAETPAEEELRLRNEFGLVEADYMRDSRGRLALTPSGGEKLGVDLSKPTLIDESGLSRYDFADLAGIGPEVAGGIAGAIAGQIAIPVPVLGAAIGAGAGASFGQGAEEVVETVSGLQMQSAEEVAKDMATEFAIGFISDATLGAFGAVARGGKGAFKAGKGLTDEELEVAAKSIDMGIEPTLSAIRAPSVVARQQGIIEKIFGTSPRLKKNNEVMQSKIAELRAKVGAANDEEVGKILLEATGKRLKTLQRAQRDAQKAVMQNLRGLGDELGAAASKNANLDNEIFDILAGAQRAFDDEVTRAFKPIDDALEVAGAGEAFIDVKNIKATAEEFASVEKAAIKGGQAPMLKSAIDAVNTLGENASYMQIYKARKALNDIMAQTRSKTERDAINQMLRQMDAKLSHNNVKTFLETAGNQITDADKEILLKASASLDNARKVYNEGAKIFEDIESAGVIKNLAAKAKGGATPGVDDVTLDKIIKNNKPKVLERALQAVEYGASKQAQKMSSEQFRDKIASQWLNDALASSGLVKGADFDPTKFKGAAFAKAVKDLGRTADVLFGSEADKVRNLANLIEKTSVSNLDQTVVNQLMRELPTNAPVLTKMNVLLNAQKQMAETQTSRALSKLQSGDLNAVEAAELIANNSTTATDISKIMSAFDPEDAAGKEAIRKIQGNYMERLISDFGDTMTTDGKQLGAFAQRLLKANEGGKLKAIFGEEVGEDMAEFARVLDFNARSAVGGDLVAANIAASPIQNLGKIVRYTIVGKLLSSGPYYKQITRDYKRLAAGKGREEKANILGRLISQSFTRGVAQFGGQELQAGAQEAERQISSVIDSSGIGAQIESLASQVTNPNISSSLPQDVNQGLGAADFYGIPQQASQPSLREQAKNSPALARALGIEGGTAGLL